MMCEEKENGDWGLFPMITSDGHRPVSAMPVVFFFPFL